MFAPTQLPFKVEYLPRKFCKVSVQHIEEEVKYLPPEETTVIVPLKGHVPIPRQQAAFGDEGTFYRFSGHTSRAQPWPWRLQVIRDQVTQMLGLPQGYFTFVLVNKYRDGSDSISAHKDSAAGLDPDSPIVSVSIGAPRRFILRWPSVNGKWLQDKRIWSLGNGDVFVMWPPTNVNCTHEIPKQPGLYGERISLTFRRILTTALPPPLPLPAPQPVAVDDAPVVVRLKRSAARGIEQGCDVYIGRKCTLGGWDLPQSKWANPFHVRDCAHSAEEAVAKFKEYILSKPELLAALPELRGKVLGCWCKPGPCHGDVLVELFNAREGMVRGTEGKQ